jgi:hypothetical protein
MNWRTKGKRPRTQAQVVFAAIRATYEALDLEGVSPPLDRTMAAMAVAVLAGRRLTDRSDLDALLHVADGATGPVLAIALALDHMNEDRGHRAWVGAVYAALSGAAASAPVEVYPDAPDGEW